MAAGDALNSYPSAISGQFGLMSGMTGLFLESVDSKPTRTETKHQDHRGVLSALIYSDPQLTVSIKGKVKHRSTGTVVPGTAHPGATTIAVGSAGAFFSTDTDWGFTSSVYASDAVFVLQQCSLSQKRADLDDLSFDMILFSTHAES